MTHLPMVAKRRYLPDLSKEFSGHHGSGTCDLRWCYPTPGTIPINWALMPSGELPSRSLPRR
ncbi:hypothetical protein ACLK1S_26465 [Escherichia coli]